MLNYAVGVLDHLSGAREGVTALEYGLLAGLIAAVVIVAVGVLGANVSTLFSTVANTI